MRHSGDVSERPTPSIEVEYAQLTRIPDAFARTIAADTGMLFDAQP